MDISLSLIPYEDKAILNNLIQLYRYDSSEFDGHILNYHGLYSYKYIDHQWTDSYRRPFVVKVNGEIAGFVLVILDVPREYVKLSTSVKTNVISDFFIMKKYRRKGVGKEVAFSLFNQFKGFWEIRQTEANKEAYIFWKHVIIEYTNSSLIHEKILNNEKWRGPVIVFES
ncbi:GNAT family N-acetyltransferase [Ornithinibacillus salinisoli]|uniref:GNAT family N-acetyltransferase n=1 Tax=Ornithinibacillus salinisoli TaxID=1848459 RepID=A0ABW4W3X0_9BACI